jgi:hypothetical protein
MKTKIFFAFILMLAICNIGIAQSNDGEIPLQKVKQWIEKEVLPKVELKPDGDNILVSNTIEDIISWGKTTAKKRIQEGRDIGPYLIPDAFSDKWIRVEYNVGYREEGKLVINTILEVDLGEFTIRYGVTEHLNSDTKKKIFEWALLTKKDFFKDEYESLYITRESAGAKNLKPFPFLFGE